MIVEETKLIVRWNDSFHVDRGFVGVRLLMQH